MTDTRQALAALEQLRYSALNADWHTFDAVLIELRAALSAQPVAGAAPAPEPSAGRANHERKAMSTKPNQSKGLVSIENHNRLTAGPAAWTSTRIAEDQFQIARAVFGTGSEDDDKRVYRTLQAYEWKRTHTDSPHGDYIASTSAPSTPPPAVVEAVPLMIPASKCRGTTDSRCHYFAHCGLPCNKCGRVHDGGIAPKAAQEKT